LWYGLAQNGLLNLMHEASHSLVFTRRRGSDLLGRWLLGPLALANFDSYRTRHWDHHRKLGEHDDPKTTYHENIRGWHLAALLLRCLALVEAARKLTVQTTSRGPLPEHAEEPPLLRPWMGRVVLVQALFFASLLATAAVGGGTAESTLLAAALAYVGVYLYGLSALTVFAAALRAIAEHQVGPDEPATVGSAALRNFTCNPLSRAVLGAYGFGEHATHHLSPSIPYYQLPAATRELAAEDGRYTPSGGYVGTLLRLVRWKAPPHAEHRAALPATQEQRAGPSAPPPAAAEATPRA
jgi:fatty acid desaturase